MKNSAIILKTATQELLKYYYELLLHENSFCFVMYCNIIQYVIIKTIMLTSFNGVKTKIFSLVSFTSQHSSANVLQVVKSSFFKFNRVLLRKYRKHINKQFMALQN